MEENLTEESKVLFEQRHAELVRIIESFENLEKSKEWETLKELIFDKALASIERQMLTESQNSDVDTKKLYRLQGEHSWAKRFCDINRFIESQKKQLEEINRKIK